MRNCWNYLYLGCFLISLSSGCATRYKLVRVERVGPVEVEIWKDNVDNTCQRRVYIDSYYYHGVVKCESQSK